MKPYQALWERGIAVFSLYPMFKAEIAGKPGKFEYRCQCGNQHCDPKNAGKHPVASNWQHTPVWSDEQMEPIISHDMYGHGYGVLCKGLLVIDVDARNGGVESFKRLAEAVPSITGAGMIVETGSGGGSKHYYFTLPEAVAMVQHLDDYKGIDFKSSGYVVGPDSLHRSGKRYEIVHGSPDEIEEAPAELIELLRRPDRHRTEYNGSSIDVSHEDIADMLAHIENTDLDYEVWIRIGMAVHQATAGTGYELWRSWSARSTKHDERAMENKWHSFGRSANPVTIGTLIHHAEAGGWSFPVTFSPTTKFEIPDAVEQRDGLPVDISGVDLLRPPGFAGSLKSWIDAQCRYPRERLAVAATLVALGNIIGLKYTDEWNITSNLFMVCIAGTGTGKEAVMTALGEIHRVTKLAPAMHGAIKSEQEIIRNLIDHQAAFYNIDEIGLVLRKIYNSSKRGGASYMEGVISTFMNCYAKGNSFMIVSGDVKRSIKQALLKDISDMRRKIDENEDDGDGKRRLPILEARMNSMDMGLERPFISIIGFTTPIGFDEIVDEENATNGFIGRCLIVSEKETNPRPKKGFKIQPMDEFMARSLMQLRDGGIYDQSEFRVEYYGNKIIVEDSRDVRELLPEINMWFINYAEEHKSKTALEGLIRRGYEMVLKVSLILAAPEGVRTVEHVRWAFAYAKADVDERIKLVISNDPTRGIQDQIFAKIMRHIDRDHGEKFGTICNRMRKIKQDDIKTILDKMISLGLVEKKEEKHPSTGKTFERYFMKKG